MENLSSHRRFVKAFHSFTSRDEKDRHIAIVKGSLTNRVFSPQVMAQHLIGMLDVHTREIYEISKYYSFLSTEHYIQLHRSVETL